MSQNTDENSDWLALHQRRVFDEDTDVSDASVAGELGMRVPINNTGSSNRSVGLFKSGDWSEGSINKAVVETYRASGKSGLEPVYVEDPDPSDERIKAQGGVFSLIELRPYINLDMMYGYESSGANNVHGDAWNRVPGDMSSYRGYPTPILQKFVIERDVLSTTYTMNITGRYNETYTDPDGPKYMSVKSWAEIKYPLPFDFIYEAKVNFAVGVPHSNEHIYKYLIKAGETRTTHYLDTAVTPNLWKPLVAGGAFFQVQTYNGSTWDLSGTVSASITLQNSTGIIQEPYYGGFSTQTVDIEQDEYHYVAPPTFKPFGQWITGMRVGPPASAWLYPTEGIPEDTTRTDLDMHKGSPEIQYVNLYINNDADAYSPQLGDTLSFTDTPNFSSSYLKNTWVVLATDNEDGTWTVTDFIQTGDAAEIIKLWNSIV